MILPRGSILSVNNGTLSGTLTEHGRSPLNLSTERIGSKERMWNGTMRAGFVAIKYTLDTSWSMLPSLDTAAVDGYKAGKWIKDFYDSTTGTVALTLNYDGTDLAVTALMTSFSYVVNKRTTNAGNYDLVDISITFEEV